nr:MAG TPA: hypothetical protein [Caudoviricetes sp.]
MRPSEKQKQVLRLFRRPVPLPAILSEKNQRQTAV